MYRTFTIYITSENVSEPLMGLLGFYDFDNQWMRDESNSAIVNEIVHALTDVGYKWVVEVEYDTVYETGVKHYSTLEEWSQWYDN